MKAVMWSKPGCPYCVMAEELLNKKGYEIEERKIGFGWNREQLFEAVPNVKTVPQIFLDVAWHLPDHGRFAWAWSLAEGPGQGRWRCRKLTTS